MTSDSGRHAQRGDAKQAPSERCQSGPEGIAQMTSPRDRVEPCPLCEAAMLPYETRDWGTFHKHPMSDCPLSDFRIAPKHRQAWNTRQSPEAVTDEMIEAGVAELERGGNIHTAVVRAIYKAMRDAALLKVSPR